MMELLEVERTVLPAKNRAAVIPHLLSPASAEALHTEYTSRLRTEFIGWFRKNHSLSKLTEQLTDQELPELASALTIMGAVAALYPRWNNDVCIDRWFEGRDTTPPHRDSVLPSVSFILVLSGEMDCVINGWRFHKNAAVHNGDYVHIGPGDAICLDNTSNTHSSHPLHGTIHGSDATRLIVDYPLPRDEYTDM